MKAATSPKTDLKNPYHLRRHWVEMQCYQADLEHEIAELEAEQQRLQGQNGYFSMTAFKAPGVQKEITLKQAKLDALALLQAVASYDSLQTLIHRYKYQDNQGVCQGKRFNALLAMLEVFAYHDGLPVFQDSADQRLPKQFYLENGVAAESRNTDAGPQSAYLKLEERAIITEVRDDLLCAVNKFDHQLLLYHKKKHKMPALTADYLRDRAFKCMQISTLNALLSTIPNKEALDEFIKSTIRQYLNCPYLLGDFSKTPCMALFDSLLKVKEYYFSFTDLYEIYGLRHQLQKGLDNLSLGVTRAWHAMASETYTAAWIEEETRLKTAKIKVLDKLLLITARGEHRDFTLAMYNDPDAFKGHPSKVKYLLETLEKRHAALEARPKAKESQADSPHILLPNPLTESEQAQKMHSRYAASRKARYANKMN